MKRALITGITGQDGSYLAEHLLSLNYSVFGTVRACSSMANIEAIRTKVEVLGCDVTDSNSVVTVVDKVRPNEIYNLAGQSFQPVGWQLPGHTLEVNTIGAMNVISAIHHVDSTIKMFQASAAGMFGLCLDDYCNEHTPFKPRTPYDVSKVAAHQLCQVYRDKGLYISAGILFSHESPRRGVEMLSRKISQAVADWHVHGTEKKLYLGDIDMVRDWGCAIDIVKGMHLALQDATPYDYVFGSGELHSIAEFLNHATAYVGIKDWTKLIVIDKNLIRKEKFTAVANCARACSLLGWKHGTSFKQLVEMMVKSDIERKKQHVQTNNNL